MVLPKRFWAPNRYLSFWVLLTIVFPSVHFFPVATLFAREESTSIDKANVYLSRIAPLLKEKCIACHGPIRQEAGLRLDSAAFIKKGSDEGQIANSNEVETSRLIIRVSSASTKQRMPPEGEGVPLKPEHIQWLRDWIAHGMESPVDEPVLSGPEEHWALRPIRRNNVDGHSGTADSIDAIIDREQASKGVKPLGVADKGTLLRRLTLDLTGLPPTPSELESFFQDDRLNAYELRVSELLQRPTYGERWGRHWMDVWRYSDWDGYKEELRGSQRNIWHWREWIIESLNRNKPYNQMIVEMLAADEIDPLNQDTLRATGFLARNYHRSNRNIWLDATVEHTAKAFLGLTVNCAKCHDHKYDPISQVDYYGFRALFEPHQVRTDPMYSAAKGTGIPGFPRAFDSDPQAKTLFFIRGDEKQPDQDKLISPSVPSALPIPVNFSIAPVALPTSSSFPELLPEAEHSAMDMAWKKIDEAKATLDKLHESIKQSNIGSKASVSSNENMVSQESELLDLEFEMLKLRESHASMLSLKARFAADKAKYLSNDASKVDSLSAVALHLEQAWKEIDAELGVKRAQKAASAAKLSEAKDQVKKKAAIDKTNKELANAKEALRKLKADDGSGLLKNYTPITKAYPTQSTGRRTALARWIVDPNNPLAARVAVNHMWARHFGTPLVDNVFDFGLKTTKPELVNALDTLAATLIDSGWNMKEIHRIIVCSSAYRRASSGVGAEVDHNRTIDPDNRLYWRTKVRRLDAEEVRDSVLYVSGTLDHSMGGPDIDEELGEKVLRRSIYFRHAYEKQMTMMVMFDAASPTECYRRRPSIIPQQALVLANSTLARTASRQLGTTLGKNSAFSPNRFVESLFLHTLSRQPDPQEIAECLRFLEENGNNEKAFQSLAHVLINHNDFVTAR